MMTRVDQESLTATVRVCWEMGAPARASRIGDASADRGRRASENKDSIEEEEGNMIKRECKGEK